MQKVNCSDKKKYWENTQLHMTIIINDGLTCNVNKVCMYMTLVVSFYVFLITMGLLI